MKFLESLLAKVYITLVPTSTGTLLYGELRKNAKTLKRFEQQLFEDKSELFEALKRLKRESALSYVAFLESESTHGLVTNEVVADLSSIEIINIAKVFDLYMCKDDLYARQQQFKNIGLDFIFSPFSLLYNFYEESISHNDGLYLLIGNESITSAVMKQGVMLFSEQFFMQESLHLLDKTKITDVYVENIQTTIKAFYESKVDETMFIEKLFIADTMAFDMELENQLEETLFVEVHKQNINLAHELVVLSEKELV